MRLRFVRLYAWQAERCDPLDGLSRSGNYLSALGEPFLDVIGISEEITDALDGDLCEILCGLVKVSVGFIELLVLELSLDLLTRTDEGHTVHGCHHSLLDNLTGHVALEAFRYL